ncbi:MAG TPA: cytochrome c peroxidase [Saprospiraceae bacterium]|nr:cytochrome c peroxidase [Saprospiraceae bacterium]
MSGKLYWVGYLVIFLGLACKDVPESDLGTYDPTPYELKIPTNYPPIFIPKGNPLTEKGVQLGKKLFFDPVISFNGQFSCATCHQPQNAFSDTLTFSKGIQGHFMAMNTMPLFNIGYYQRYSWTGKINTIELDIDVTIEELHNGWESLLLKLNSDKNYPALFYQAFGKTPITQDLVEKSLAQYVRSIISFETRFDSIVSGMITPTALEMRGYELFFTEEGDCFHCHVDPLFTNTGFHNNALDVIEKMHPGFESVTGLELDRGKFKVPSLRNLAYTAPYMHDGRFKTLKEVIDFYSEGLQYSPYADSNMKNLHKGGIQISEDDKTALIAFLMTLTDKKLPEKYVSP